VNSPETPSEWGQKRYFLFVRIISAVFGVGTTIVLIRLLSIEAFAVIVVIEGVVEILKRVLGFGLGEALSREMAAEDSTFQRRQLLAYVLKVKLKLGVCAGIVLTVFAFVSVLIYDDPRVKSLFLINIPLLLFMFPQQGGQAGIRGMGHFGHLLVLQMGASFLNMVFVIVFSYFFSVYGYFIGRLVCNGVLLALTLWFLKDMLQGDVSMEERTPMDAPLSQLWDVSVFSYASGVALKAWERLPFIIGAAVLPAQAVGVAAVALKFTNRINLGNQAFTNFLAPLMTRKWVFQREGFTKHVAKEVGQIFLFNLLVGIFICLVWRFGGEKIIQAEKVDSVGMVFYAFVGLQLLLGVVNILKRLVIIPSKKLDRLLPPLIVLRLSVLPIMFLAMVSGVQQKWIIPVSLILSSVLILLLFVFRSRTILLSKYDETGEKRTFQKR